MSNYVVINSLKGGQRHTYMHTDFENKSNIKKQGMWLLFLLHSVFMGIKKYP